MGIQLSRSSVSAEKISIKTLLILSTIFYVLPVGAATFVPSGTPDVAQMLVNFSNSVPSLMRLVTALAYVMGFFFVYKGLSEFKKLGESRTMMSGEQSITGPLLHIFVGTTLIYLPSTIYVGLGTLFGNEFTPYAWKTSATDSWSLVSNSIFLIVSLVGVISFIRGLLLLNQLGGHAQPGTFAKAMTHLIAGVLCINLYGFLQVVSTTFGIGQWY